MVTFDLRDDAPRYVAEALKAATQPLSISDLVDNYDPPKPNDMGEVKSELRRELGYAPDNYEVKEKLIGGAVDDINLQNYVRCGCDPIIGLEDYKFRLADGVDADQLELDGEPLIRGPVLPDLFTPETGLWADNVRSYKPEGLKELRESMAAHGWLPHLPAIADEFGVVIVGHRRLDVAKELGIDPVIKTVHFGDGDKGQAARAALALASNVGAEKISPADRKKIAADLYGSGWSMAKIGELLKVATMTVSRDLRNLTMLNPPEKPKRGRPRKQPKPVEPVTDSDEDTLAEELIAAEPPGGLTEDTPGQTDRVKQALNGAKKKSAPKPKPDSTPADNHFVPIRFSEGSDVWSYIEAVEDIGLYAGDDLDLVTPLTADDLTEPLFRRGGDEFFRKQADRLRTVLPRIHELIELLEQRAASGAELDDIASVG